MMRVKDIMNEDVLKVSCSDNALDVGTRMDEKRISAAAVQKDDKLAGIVSKETFIANMEKLEGRTIDSMNVSDFMEEDIDTVSQEDGLKVALEKLLTQKNIIDRLPVVEAEEVVGFISKNEFTRLFSEQLRERFKVSDLMHYSPETVSDLTPLTKVVSHMKNLMVKRVLVMAGSSLVGIITIRDLSIMVFREKKVAQAVDPTSCLTAEEVMTRNPVTIGEKEDAASAADVMIEKAFGGMPVVDAEEVQGIISRTDLLKGYQLTLD